jgi:hydrogenase maturation protease
MTPELGSILVIGFGSELRSDDAIGPSVARAVDGLRLPRVRSVDVTQLTPEFAEAISSADVVIFVDATVDAAPGQVQIAPVVPAALDEPIGHLGNPRALLALAAALFRRAAPAWLVRIGVGNLEIGDQLSPAAAAALPTATEAVRALIERAGGDRDQPGSTNGHHGHDHHDHDHGEPGS